MNHERRFKAMTAMAAVVMGVILFGAAPAAPAEPVSLKVALLPIFDALPYHVAAEKGYFMSDGIRIEGVRVGSAVERDQLMQAGAIDGAVNEMIAAANFNRQSTTAMVVGSARKSVPGAPLFRILAAPGSGITRPEALSGVPIGVSMNTIIAYVTDRLLADAGLPPDRIKKQSVPVIPERFQLLIQGQLEAAVLPEPLASSAISAGAVEVMNDEAYATYSTSVLTFTRAFIDRHPEAVRFFLQGWYRAAGDINASPESYRDLTLKVIRVPKNVEKSFRLPPYPIAEVPSEGQWNDVNEWMRANGLIQRPLPYQGSVTAAFLPKP
jgi:NitT/TauT family transport system substrate-binding protein